MLQAFKAAEKDRGAFKKKQAVYRQQWDTKFSEFTTEQGRVSALGGLRGLAKTNRGLPEGLPLNTLITLCRREKVRAGAMSDRARILS